LSNEVYGTGDFWYDKSVAKKAAQGLRRRKERK